MLEALSQAAVGFVVVGGYAVSAMARHRFSVDCDLAVGERDVRGVVAVLESRGFSKVLERTGLGGPPSGRFIRFAKKLDGLPVSVDLMVGSLVCRDTEGSWSFDYIRSCSVMARVRGVGGSVRCSAPRRELLLALKLHSARMPDVRDVVMLSKGAHWEEVATHLNTGNQSKLVKSLNRVLKDLEDPRLASSLRAEFSMKQDAKAEIVETRDHLKAIVSRLKEESSRARRKAR